MKEKHTLMVIRVFHDFLSKLLFIHFELTVIISVIVYILLHIILFLIG
jgi:hypothetical protein